MSDIPIHWLSRVAVAAKDGQVHRGSRITSRYSPLGLIGEAGSVVSELKKERRERDAYPVYRDRMLEEVGDFLWYFVRLVSMAAPGLLAEMGSLPEGG